MKIPPTFLFTVVSSLLPIAASAALPTFSPQTINLPPLTLAENAAGTLRPFERSEPAAPRPVIIPERSLPRPDKFVISPPAGIDYKLLIKRPDPSIDYRMIVKPAGPQPGK